MLTPLRGKVRPRKIKVYDLEWIPHSLKLRIAGVYDSERGYKKYKTIDDFLDGELTKSNSGAIYYAHAGGKFDIQFLLHRLRQRLQYSVTVIFSGGSAIAVTVRRGRKLKWTFVDSYSLLSDGLAHIAETVGMQKPTIHDYETATEGEIENRNFADCRILHHAVEYAQELLLDLGGDLRVTLPACAMALFRRKYLREVIHTGTVLNQTVETAYVGARIEPYRETFTNGHCVDMNSAFAHSFLEPVPGDLEKTNRTLPDDERALFIADVKITVPDQFIPPLPVRDSKGRIYFPHGSWRSMYTGDDLRLLQEQGGRIDEVFAVYHFRPFWGAKGYVLSIFNKRQRTQDPFERGFYKDLLTGLYGKFAEGTIKQRALINPKYTTCPHDRAHVVDGVSQCMQQYGPGIWFQTDKVDVHHAHVPIASYVTSRARAAVTRLGRDAEMLAYIGSDSLHSRTNFPTGDGLGELHYQYTIKSAHYTAPMLFKVDPGLGPEHVFVRAKGLPRISPATYDRFVDGGAIYWDQMVPVKERLLWGETEPTERHEFRRLTHVCGLCQALTPPPAPEESAHCLAHPNAQTFALATVRPKRRMMPDGSSVPWSVGEIDRPWTGRDARAAVFSGG